MAKAAPTENLPFPEEPESYDMKDFTGRMWVVAWKDLKRGGQPSKVYTNYQHMVTAALKHHHSGEGPRVFEVNGATRLPLASLGQGSIPGSVLMED